MAREQWTTHFNEREFSVSGSRPDLVISIPARYKGSMKRVAVELLQPIRDVAGRSFRILSGYRSQELNDAIGGSRTSQHRVGEAADFTASRLRDIVYTIISLVRAGDLDSAGQIIYYPEEQFIHIALTSRRYPRPTLCIYWEDQDLNYTQCPWDVESFDDLVPADLDPNEA